MKNIFLSLLLSLSINSYSQTTTKTITDSLSWSSISGEPTTLSSGKAVSKTEILNLYGLRNKVYVVAIQYVHRNYIMIDDKVKFIERKNGKWYTDKGKLVKVVWYKLRYGSTYEWIDASYLDY